MFKEIKSDMLKSIVLVLGIIIFVVGIVLTSINSKNTYAESSSDYGCAASGYAVTVSSEGKYYCCPSGWNYSSDLGKCQKI